MLDRILRIDDPRDNLEKARLGELESFARANKVEFKQGIPAILLRKILRTRKLVNITIPNRTLGQHQPNVGETPAALTADTAVETDAVAELERQYMQQEKPIEAMNMSELRKACTGRGIKMERTDNMAKLRAKLQG